MSDDIITTKQAMDAYLQPAIEQMEQKHAMYRDKISAEVAAIMGEHTCKEIIEGVWEHTWTLPDSRWYLTISPKRWVEADPFFDNPHANCALARMAQREASQHRRELRNRKRTRRQHRAAFRRRKRGLA